MHSLHASYRLLFVDKFCALTLSNAVYPWSLFCFLFSFSSILLESWLRRLEQRKPLPHPLLISSDRFRFRKNQEAYEKLIVFRLVWAEHKVILDEVDPEICSNFERRGWLLLLDVGHPPSAALIREFYSNLSIHFDDSNIHFVASALNVPLVQ